MNEYKQTFHPIVQGHYINFHLFYSELLQWFRSWRIDRRKNANAQQSSEFGSSAGDYQKNPRPRLWPSPAGAAVEAAAPLKPSPEPPLAAAATCCAAGAAAEAAAVPQPSKPPARRRRRRLPRRRACLVLATWPAAAAALGLVASGSGWVELVTRCRVWAFVSFFY